MAYFTLLSKSGTSQKWIIEFGDHEREVVKQEAEDSYSHILKRNQKIIKTKTSNQKEIDAKVLKLNTELQAKIDFWNKLESASKKVQS